MTLTRHFRFVWSRHCNVEGLTDSLSDSLALRGLQQGMPLAPPLHLLHCYLTLQPHRQGLVQGIM